MSKKAEKKKCWVCAATDAEQVQLYEGAPEEWLCPRCVRQFKEWRRMGRPRA